MIYDDGMKSASMLSRISPNSQARIAGFWESHEETDAFRVVGWTSLALGVAAVGLYIGHELRSRYKFKRRTPYDFFAHAGDSIPAADYGMGI